MKLGRVQPLSLCCEKYISLLKKNPPAANILQTNPKVDHRTEEVNKSNSSGHNFFKSGPVEKTTTTLDSPYPISWFLCFEPKLGLNRFKMCFLGSDFTSTNRENGFFQQFFLLHCLPCNEYEGPCYLCNSTLLQKNSG